MWRIAGALRATNKLVKLAFGSERAMACASYAPEGRDADRLVVEMAQDTGLQIAPDVAQRLARGCHGDRAILASELEKLSLYLDAAPDRPRRVEHDALDALAASSDEGDLSRLANITLSGDVVALDRELTQLASEGLVGIPLLRAILRRMHLLTRLRAQVEQGNSAQSVIAKAGPGDFLEGQGGDHRSGRALAQRRPCHRDTARQCGGTGTQTLGRTRNGERR